MFIGSMGPDWGGWLGTNGFLCGGLLWGFTSQMFGGGGWWFILLIHSVFTTPSIFIWCFGEISDLHGNTL